MWGVANKGLSRGKIITLLHAVHVAWQGDHHPLFLPCSQFHCRRTCPTIRNRHSRHTLTPDFEKTQENRGRITIPLRFPVVSWLFCALFFPKLWEGEKNYLFGELLWRQRSFGTHGTTWPLNTEWCRGTTASPPLNFFLGHDDHIISKMLPHGICGLSHPPALTVA